MELPDRVDAKRWEGLDVVDRHDEVLGSCVGVFADADTEVTEWLLLDVPGHRRTFVPALDAVESDGRVRVAFARERVVTAPPVGDETHLTQSEERALYDHYGVAVSEDDSASLLPEDAVGEDDGVPPLPLAPAWVPYVPDARPRPVSSAGDQGVTPGVAVAPVAAVGGLVVAVWLGLRVRDRRARRRRSLPARTERLGRQVGAGLAAVATQASVGAARGSQAAAEFQREAAKVAAQRRKEAAKAAAVHREQATKAAVQRRKHAAAELGTATVAVTHRAGEMTGTVAQTRSSVAKRVRKARRTFSRRVLGTGAAVAAGGGYVLGARAGRERYDQIAGAVTGAAAQPAAWPPGGAPAYPTGRPAPVGEVRTPSPGAEAPPLR